MRSEDVEALLEQSHDPEPRIRRRTLRELCPCEIRVNVDAVWDRVLEMRTDPDPKMRSLVLHTLCDGSAAAGLADVVAAVEAMQCDPDTRLRRRARGIVAAYRRTGKINQL